MYCHNVRSIAVTLGEEFHGCVEVYQVVDDDYFGGYGGYGVQPLGVVCYVVYYV